MIKSFFFEGLSLIFLLLLAENSRAMQVSFQSGILSVVVDRVGEGCRVELLAGEGGSFVSIGSGRPVAGVFSKSISGIEPASSGTSIIVEARVNCGLETQTKRRRVVVDGGVLSKKEFLVGLRKKVLEDSIMLKEYFTGFEQPVDLQSSGREIFVVEQTGKIKRITNNQISVFLEISERISVGGERGLLGLALHPDFRRNRYIFVNYTRKLDGATVISRFKGKREKVLLVVPKRFASHNGGGLAFGPDGYLYIALGDGGSAGDPEGNGQNKRTLLGKILRIDVNTRKKYEIPRSNPFVGNTQGFKEEIFAYGFRNPWRISFHGRDLFVGDVGQSTREEINIVRRGKNYGWKIKEGSTCYNAEQCDSTGLVDPIYEYGRDVGGSVIGGYVARNYNNLKGVYIFGDFVSGRIYGLEKVLGDWVGTEILDTDIYISSFGRCPKGKLCLLDYLGGRVLKVEER